MDKATGNLKQQQDQHKNQTQVPSQVADIPLQVEKQPDKKVQRCFTQPSSFIKESNKAFVRKLIIADNMDQK